MDDRDDIKNNFLIESVGRRVPEQKQFLRDSDKDWQITNWGDRQIFKLQREWVQFTVICKVLFKHNETRLNIKPLSDHWYKY